MKKTASILTALLLCFLLAVPAAALEAQDPAAPEGAAPSAVLIERQTGTVLYAKNETERRPPASVTKVMTLLLIAEAVDSGELALDDMVTASERAASMGGSQIWLEVGEQLSVSDMIKCVAVVSANDCAVALAEHLCGSEAAFVERMNQKAEELGCENTNFKDPTGISANDHYTTPEDMVRMCRYAMSFDQFREAVSYPDGEVPASNVRDEGFTYETTNFVMFPDDRYESPYARYMTGIKTGWTPAAGYCFSGCMEKDGLVFYSVAMGGEELMYKDGQRIVQGDFLDTIELYTLTDGLRAEGPDTTPEDMAVTSILGAGTFHVKLPDGANILVQNGQTVTAEYDIPSTVFGPVSEGDTVGTVTLKAGDTEKTVDLVAASSRGISPLIIGGAAAIVATAAVIILKMSKRKNNV